MKGIYKVTFEVECCEDTINKYLNHKRWGKDPRSEGDVEKFVTEFAKRHIEAGFCRVKMPLAPHQRSLDWLFKWFPKGMESCTVVKLREEEDT